MTRRCGVLIAMVVVGCAVDVRAAEAQCTYSVSQTTVSAQSTGLNNSSISVITGTSCTWTAVSSVPWITVNTGTMSGLGSFNFTVAPNGTGAVRTGTITVGGKIVTVTQSTGSCAYSVSPTSFSAPSTGLISSISVITGSSCAWTPVSSVPWITITSGGMSGLGSVSFSVAASTSPRTGTITVAGQTVTITQLGGQQPPAPPANLRIVIVS